jgi:hypothetical protein
MAERREEKFNKETTGSKIKFMAKGIWSHLMKQVLMQIKICSNRNTWTDATRNANR